MGWPLVQTQPIVSSRPGLATRRRVTRIQGQAVTNLEPGLASAGTYNHSLAQFTLSPSNAIAGRPHWAPLYVPALEERCTACRGLCARSNMGFCCIQGPLRAHSRTATTSRPLRYYVPHPYDLTDRPDLSLPPCGVDYDISPTGFIFSLTD